MNVVICGAGEVGRHAAEVLAEDANNITVIDLSAHKLAALDEMLDVRSLVGNGTQADVLVEAGAAKADLFIAATNIDEINLLSASIAKGVGARQCIARVHHAAYFEKRGIDYADHLAIDHLVCPEHSTALAIAAALRSPGALAVENFARGRIEMQQLAVGENSKAVGVMLRDLKLPSSTRLAAVDRSGEAFLPRASTVLEADDIVTLIGETDSFQQARKLFYTESDRRRRVIILGGTGQSVWLCRAMKDTGFSIRLFEPDAARAEELAEKLPWVTVLRADAINTDALRDERVDQADAFIALTDDDEQNILAAARAKSMGCPTAIAVLQRGTYLHLLDYVGIDRAFSPRVTAVNEVLRLIESGPVRELAVLSEGVLHVYEVRVTRQASALIDHPLRSIRFPTPLVVAAIQRGEDTVFVPGADSHIRAGDTMIVIGPPELRKKMPAMLNA
jgi:trk system potassium uptake protein TrkA